MAQFPETWWRDRPLVIAHRGASHAAPQNTLAAFRVARDMGADGVELDVHLSADRVPVVIHNATVEATTNGSGAVREMTLAELQSLDAGAYFAPAFSREPIPTLEEVLDAVGQDLLVNIEFKDNSLRGCGLESAVAALLWRVDMVNRVWFSSFNPFSLRRARAVIPEVPCGLLYSDDVPFYLRGRWFAPLTPHEALHPDHANVTEDLIRRAHRRGLRVATWTLDDPTRARELATWSVDAVISNEPDQMLTALVKNT